MPRAYEGLGVDRDVVHVIIGGQRFNTKRYALSSAFFSRQPSTFSAELQVGDPLRVHYDRVKPGMDYEVRIDGVLQQSGRLDSVNGSVDANGSTLTVSGRDILAKLHDAKAEKDYGFNQGSYYDVVIRVLDILGIDADLISTNDAERAAVSNKKQKVLKRPKTTGQGNTGFAESAMHIKAGEAWYPWLKQILDHAGLVLRATSLGQLLLSAPNPDQVPTYALIFAPSIDRGRKFVISGSKNNNTNQRPSKVIVRCKGGGKKSGAKDIEGVAVDEEMVGYGIERVQVIKDFKGATIEAATKYAQRKIAEARRIGFGFTYEIVGHSWESDDQRDIAIWAPDTIVSVDDREHGYSGPLWIESIDMKRGPQTTTQISCMRPDDVRFFGEE